MLICAAGDTHGAIDRFYGDLAALEARRRLCGLAGGVARRAPADDLRPGQPRGLRLAVRARQPRDLAWFDVAAEWARREDQEAA